MPNVNVYNLSEGSWRKLEELANATRNSDTAITHEHCLGAITLNIPMHAKGVHVGVGHVVFDIGLITEAMVREEAARIKLELPAVPFDVHILTEGTYRLLLPESDAMDFGFKLLIVVVKAWACVFPEDYRKRDSSPYGNLLQTRRDLGNTVANKIVDSSLYTTCSRFPKPKRFQFLRSLYAAFKRRKRCIATVEVACGSKLYNLSGWESGFLDAALYTAVVRGATSVLSWQGWCGMNVPSYADAQGTKYAQITQHNGGEFVRYRIVEVHMAIAPESKKPGFEDVE